MLPLDKLHQAVSQAGEEGLFDKLQAVYDQVPETECDRCATCCTVPQPAYIVEYLNMFRYVNSRMPKAWPELIAKPNKKTPREKRLAEQKLKHHLIRILATAKQVHTKRRVENFLRAP